MIRLNLDFSGLEDTIAAFDGPRVRLAPHRDSSQGSRVVPLTAIVREGAMTGLIRVLTFLVGRSRINAPVDTGALRNSIVGMLGSVVVAGRGGFPGATTSRGVVSGRSAGSVTRAFPSLNDAVRLDARVVANAPYAYFVHEFFIPAPGGTINSQVFHETEEGRVGGKYIERVVNHHVRTINDIMVRAMRDSLAHARFQARGSKVIGARPTLADVLPATGLQGLDGGLEGVSIQGSFFGSPFGAAEEI